jgi:hypothetical protein
MRQALMLNIFSSLICEKCQKINSGNPEIYAREATLPFTSQAFSDSKKHTGHEERSRASHSPIVL